MPRILIADDNPLSLRFLLEALAQLGIAADGAGDGMDAVMQTAQQHYELLLLDYRMPKLNGPETLQRIRSANVTTPAIATSAEITPIQRAELLTCGFVQVLEKPLTLVALENAIRPYFPLLETYANAKEKNLTVVTADLLDDAAALPRIGGDSGILRVLRNLFVDELIMLPAEFERLRQSRDHNALHERLHRLQASAGICGASALASACSAMRNCIDIANVTMESSLDEVQRIAAATLAALRDAKR